MDFPTNCFCSYYFIWLRHLTGTIYLSLMINLYFYLNTVFLCFICTAHNLSLVCGRHIVESCIKFPCVLRRYNRNLNFNDLNIVLFVIGSVCTNKQPLNWKLTAVRTIIYAGLIDNKAYISLVGIHSAVRDGQVNACEYKVSYRNGACFFHILYSSKIRCSSISSTLSTTKWYIS